MDVWIKEQFPNASRGHVNDSIRTEFATVNGRSVLKPSFPVEGGDHVVFALCGGAQLEAKPGDIQLDIVYEDEHVLVINKSADMVVHPGSRTFNWYTSECRSSSLWCLCCRGVSSNGDESEYEGEELEEIEDEEDDEINEATSLQLFRGPNQGIRSGIVHRLDKGTTASWLLQKQNRLTLTSANNSRPGKQVLHVAHLQIQAVASRQTLFATHGIGSV